MLVCSNRRLLFLQYAAFAISILLGASTPIFGQDSETMALRHFRSAQEAQQAGSFDLAAREYLKVIQLRPDAAEAYASLGLVYNAEGKFADSARALGKAEKLKPGLPGVSLYLGIDYVKLRQAAVAIPYLREAARLEPQNKEVQTWLSTALWEDGHIEAALAQFRSATLRSPSDPVLLLDLGEAYRKAADERIERVLIGAKGAPLLHQVYGDIYKDERTWQNARAHYYRAIEQDPQWRGAHFGLGEIDLLTGKLDEAAQEYRRELQINPNSAASLARLAEIALLQGKPEDALALFQSAIHIAPEQASNAVGLPRSYPASARNFSEETVRELRNCIPSLESSPASPSRSLALAVAESLVGNDDGFTAAWTGFQSSARNSAPSNSYERGLLNFNRQDFHAAETDLDAWLTLHPNDLGAEYLLARTYRNLSSSTFAQLLAVAPDSYPAHQLLAETYRNAGQDDKALAEYRAVENMSPNLPGIHFSIGSLLLKMGQPDQAMGELEAELRLNPDHAEANAAVGKILIARSEQAKAIPYLEKASQLDPEQWATFEQLGKAYYLQKEFAKAEAVLRKAVKHDPDGSVHYQLALVYRALGQTETASQQFEISRKLKLASLSHAETEMTTLDTLPQ